MFWALLFTALIAIFGHESPYLIPHMDKHIKKNVDDPVRKDTLLLVLKEVKKEKKSRKKENEKLAKQMNNFFASRESTQQDFDELIDKIEQRSKILDQSNLKIRIVFKENILVDEWGSMQADMEKEMNKLLKKMNKGFDRLDKSITKLNKSIESTVVDVEKRNAAMESLKSYRSFLNVKKEEYLKSLSLENSVFLNYETSNEDFDLFQSDLREKFIATLRAQELFHDEMVKNTTEKEWKKLSGKMKVF